jgi:hypothetical protein
VVFAATSQTFFGQSLPSDWLDWLVLLIAIWSGFSIVRVVAAEFVEQHKKLPTNLRLGSYVFPGGWIVWSGLLLYAEPGPLSALVFLVGAMAMLAAVKSFRR